ncbi:MAG TPA: hypothetical protein VGL20_01615 [Candidatus Dormibacteraeota bacterium]|jgi:membrane associated rhomboid family serine protease
MPRAQKKRAARAASVPGAVPEPVRAPGPEAGPSDAAPADQPQPWPARSLLVLAGLVAALQVPLALLDLLRDHHRYGFLVYLVVTLAPVSLLQQAQLLAAYVIAMPVAARLAHEGRPMRLSETMSVAAIVLILLSSLWQLALHLGGGHGVGENGQVHAGALAAGAAADIGALVGGSLLYPWLYRRFWMRRRRLRR